jgi:hypothetical protein
MSMQVRTFGKLACGSRESGVRDDRAGVAAIVEPAGRRLLDGAVSDETLKPLARIAMRRSRERCGRDGDNSLGRIAGAV